MAHDYRIVAEDTVFENLNADIGLITKGSGYFLPRLLGIRKATEVLQWKSFSAEDALQLGLVDRIVPVSKLEEETMQACWRLGRSSLTLLASASCSSATPKNSSVALNLEDDLIKERLNSAEFRKTFAADRNNVGKLMWPQIVLDALKIAKMGKALTFLGPDTQFANLPRYY